MTHFGAQADSDPVDPLAYDPAVDGIFPDQPSGEPDLAVASSEAEAAEWALTAAAAQESYEPPSYADDSDS